MSWAKKPMDAIKSEDRYSFVGGPFGSELTTRDYVAEGIPVIRGNNLATQSKFFDDNFVFVSDQKARQLESNMARPGDLIFTQRGTLGQVGIIPQNARFERYVVSQSQMKLTVNKEKADPLFLYHYFRLPSTVRDILTRVSSSGVPHINLSTLKTFQVPLPPLPVQNSLVRIAEAYDSLIENNRRRIQLLEQAARFLYREWFVYFRFPGYEHVKIIDHVPQGWKLEPLSARSKAVMGQSPPSKFYNESGEGLPFHQGVRDFGDRFPAHRVHCTLRHRVAEPGDILFSVRAPVGRINLAQERLVIGRGVAALRAIDGRQAMLHYQLRAHFHKEDMMGTGAIFAAVKNNDLFGVKLLTAPAFLVEQFETVVIPVDRQIQILSE